MSIFRRQDNEKHPVQDFFTPEPYAGHSVAAIHQTLYIINGADHFFIYTLFLGSRMFLLRVAWVGYVTRRNREYFTSAIARSTPT